MQTHKPRWLDTILTANNNFQTRIEPTKLPTQRTPGTVAVITCMDPRVNLEASGISQFAPNGEGQSSVRIIRTLGAMAEERSLVVGIFLAGIHEIAVLMHTDCGCCAAFSRVDTIIERMQKNVDATQLRQFKTEIGEPFEERLRVWLKAFSDPYEAVLYEVKAIRTLPFAPQQLVVHGLVYDLASGSVDVVVNGYQ
ncbi:MAG: hypothetical protein GY832_00250 [Chloroflexi bacterium]|nr:hypothetical protein [Chloroflexota bacterium]